MENLVIDPVCGAKLTPNSAIGQYRYLGQTYYFCSVYCTNAFDDDREKYAGEIDTDFPFEEEE